MLQTMRRNLLTTLIVFFIVSVRVCSQGLIPLIQQSGKYFHKVTVHKGLTLTGIKSKFNVTEEQLKKANPSLTSALAIGQEVLVPARKETFNHKVVKGETMYSICQRYQITIDTLKAANRVLMNSDIKIDQTLVIRNGIQRFAAFQPQDASAASPATNASAVAVPKVPMADAPKIVDVYDSSFWYVMKKGEDLSSISQRFLVSGAALMRINALNRFEVSEGTKLKIPVDYYEKERQDDLGFKRTNGVQERFYQNGYRSIPSPCVLKDSVKITMIIPMNFKDFKHPVSRGKQKALYDFFNGAKMARDSLVKLGVKGDLFVYDCLTKGEEVTHLINKRKLSTTDIIILPYRITGLDTLITYSEENQIPLFCFFKLNEDEKFQNPFLYIVPTMPNLVFQHMGYSLAKQGDSKEIFLVSTRKKEDALKEQQFTEAYQSVGGRKLTTVSFSNLDETLKTQTQKYIVCLSSDTNLVLPLIKNTYQKTNTFLIGTRDWTDMNQLSKTEENPAKFYYWSTTCFDGNLPSLAVFKKNFKAANTYDLNKSAAFGYDAMFLLGSWFFNLGNNFNRNGIMTQIDFIRNGNNVALNQALSLCRYSNGQNTRNVRFE